MGPQADVSLGTSIVESMGDKLKVTVIATGFGEVEDMDIESVDIRLPESLKSKNASREVERDRIPFILGAARNSGKEERKKHPPFFRS